MRLSKAVFATLRSPVSIFSVALVIAATIIGAVQAAPNFSLSQSASPASPSVARLPNRTGSVGGLSNVSGPWLDLGPQPISDERCCTTLAQSAYGNASGRVTSLVVSPTNANTVFAGSAGGGVWKTTDGGSHWTALTDQQSSLAIGALAVDASGQNLYAGTGEEGILGVSAGCTDCQYGQGILKSADGGNSWTLVGQATFARQYVGAIAIDRSDPSARTVWVATNSGLYVTTDGGTSWTQNTTILPQISLKTGLTRPSGATLNIVQDPTNAQTFWATASDGGQTEAGDVLVTSDNGSTWRRVLDVSSQYGAGTVAGRISLAVGASAAYAMISDTTGNLFDIRKSSDGGVNWTSLKTSSGYCNLFNLDEVTGTACNSSAGTNGSGLNSNTIAIDPNTASHVVFGGDTILTSSDGGTSFQDAGKVYSGGFIHPGFHAFAFFGPSSFYAATDGGVWKTTDLGGTGTSSDWTNLNATLGISQFFHGTSLDQTRLIGGTEDNGSPGALPGSPAVKPAWQDYHGGEGTFTALDPATGTVFISHDALDMERGNWAANPGDPLWPYDTFRPIGPCISGQGPACSDQRAPVAPFRLDPTNPQHILAGGTKIYETNNAEATDSTSVTWAPISGNLTFSTSGFPQDVLTMIRAGQSTALAKTVFTTSWFGRVFMTTDDFQSTTEITGDLPGYNTADNAFAPWVSDLAFNPTNTQEAWVTIGGFSTQGSPVSHVYHTTNAGAAGGQTHWASLDPSNQLPNAPVSAILFVPSASGGTIYVGTYYGVYACATCVGSSPSPSWSLVGSGLPNVWVSDLTETSDGYLVAWTHGRGVWEWTVKNRIYLPTISH